MGNVPHEMIYASVCAEVCRFLLETAKGGAGGESRIWFNCDLILQLNFASGQEEDVRQKQININMFPSTQYVLNNPN